MVEEIEVTMLEEVDVEFFEFIQLSKDVTSIKLSEDIFDEKLPSYSSLLAVSNLYGYFVAGTSNGFIYAYTNDLYKGFVSPKPEPFKQEVHIDIPEGRVCFLRLTSDQLTIIVGIEGGRALYYDVTKISTKSSEIQPYQIMRFSDNIMDIRPNPGERDSLVALLLVSGAVYIKDFISNKEIGSIQKSKIGEQITAICWSQKGKQLICGSQTGKLVQFTPEGNEKATYQTPPEIEPNSYFVRNILWLETNIFIVTYYPVVQDENSEHVVYVISRENKPKIVYSKVPNICLPSGEKSPYMFMESIREWGPDLKNVVICACTNSSDINLIGRNESNEWSSWSLSETARAILPSSDNPDNLNDTIPIGMALDLSPTESWQMKLTGDEVSQIPPVPILLIYNNESKILAYHCFQKNAYQAKTGYPGMTVPIPIPATGPSAVITISPNMFGTTTVGAQTTVTSVINTVSTPVITPNITNVPKNNIPPLGHPNLKNNIAIAAVGTNAQNVPLKSQAKQISPTGPDINIERLPHEIRRDATEKSVQEIKLLIDDIEKKYLIKYKERTKSDSLKNPNEWSIGDFPVIISETKRLEKEIKNIIEYLNILKQETTDLNLNFVKEDAMAKQEIELLVSSQEVTPRRGTIQSRITEKYEKAFKNVKENADALEKQLDMLYEQIKDHKANKYAGRPPLEYIDRSIQNISKGLHSNASQIEQLNTQLDLITEQLSSMSFNERANDFVSQQIEHETRKSTIPIKCSDEAEEKTNQIMKKEWKLFKILNINKSKRKVPYETNLFSDIEPVQSYTSPKIISPRKKSPIKTRGSTQLGIEKLNDSIDRNKYSSPLRNSFSFDDESDYFNELDTPIKRNTYTEVGLPISEDTDDFSQKYNQKVAELREMRLRYFEKKDDVNDNVNDDDNVDANDDFNDDYNDDVNGDVYSDNNPTYELREARVRFQEPSDDDADENTKDSIQQKFEDIVDSDRISRIHLTNNDDNYDRIARLQIDPFESNFYEPSKFSDTNNFSDYLVSSPESPKTEEGVFYSLNNEQKDTTTSEQSSTIQDSLEESLEAKFNKLNAAEISSLSKVSEPRQFDVGEESKSDIISSEELEKREIIEEKVESVSLEAEPSEITIDSKVGVVSQQPLITREKVVTNEGDDSTNFGSLGSREPSSFGGTTFTPPAPSAFSIPPAFATQSPNVNAFNRTQPFGQPSFSQSSSIPSAPNTPTFGQTGFSTPFGQPSFGQSSSIPSALIAPTFGQTGFPAPSFGQTGFGQPTFGRVGLGQPAFGQTGMGTPGFGVPSPINTAALKTPSGGGFARFASGGSGVGFGSPSNVSTSASNKPPATVSNPTWSEIRK